MAEDLVDLQGIAELAQKSLEDTRRMVLENVQFPRSVLVTERGAYYRKTEVEEFLRRQKKGETW